MLLFLKLLSRRVKGTRPPAKTVRRGEWGSSGCLEAQPCSPAAYLEDAAELSQVELKGKVGAHG